MRRLEDDGTVGGFQRDVPMSAIAACLRVQQKLRPAEVGYSSIAFALAYYHVDYARNLNRLLLPYDRYPIGRKSKDPPALAERDRESVLVLPYDLYVLHSRFHDSVSLGTLLDLQLDGGPGEVQMEELIKFWRHEQRRMLRLAAGQPNRQETIAMMITVELEAERPSPTTRRPLRLLANNSDQRLAAGARGVLRKLREIQSPNRADQLGAALCGRPQPANTRT